MALGKFQPKMSWNSSPSVSVVFKGINDERDQERSVQARIEQTPIGCLMTMFLRPSVLAGMTSPYERRASAL
jgi:hypothetical protein